MIWTFLVAVADLIIAVLGCALAKPLGSLESYVDGSGHHWRCGKDKRSGHGRGGQGQTRPSLARPSGRRPFRPT